MLYNNASDDGGKNGNSTQARKHQQLLRIYYGSVYSLLSREFDATKKCNGAVVRIFGGIVGSQAIDPTLPNL